MYSIRLARSDELSLLPAIEDAAGSLFIQDEQTAHLPSDSTPSEEFAEAQRSGLLWVAVNAQDAPVGFALVELMDGAAHLEEIDVLPGAGRRGIGTALVRTVCEWAASRQMPVTLTTFRDIPWNAPFYARLGFRELAVTELTPALRARVADEAARGLPAELRIVMQCDEAAGSPF